MSNSPEHSYVCNRLGRIRILPLASGQLACTKNKLIRMNAVSSSTPLVTMIMAAYNAEPFLEQSLGSLLNQTYTNFEIICVDDGSTDGTVAEIERIAASHTNGNKIHLLHTNHVGAGEARNLALRQAHGEYIGFLDADDFVDSRLLEKAISRAKDTAADIVIWDLWYFDNNAKLDQYPPVGTLSFNEFDDGSPTFNYKKNPDHIFNSFQNWIWNKLFRKSLLEENHILFPDWPRAQDLQFTCLALLTAQRITLLYERLSHYRINRSNSNMESSNKHPIDFLHAFIQFREELEQRGYYEEVQRSYVNWALHSALSNMFFFQHQYDTFALVFDALRAGGFQKMDITNHATSDYIFETEWLKEYHMIMSDTPENALMYFTQRIMSDNATLVSELNRADREKIQLQSQIEQQTRAMEVLQKNCEQELQNTRRSAEYRLGRLALRIPRALQRRLHR